MSFDNELKKALDNIEVPEELLPENIEAMLRKVGRQDIKTTEKASADEERSVKITTSRTNRAVIMRTLAAAAACVALAAGFTAFREENAKPAEIESEIEYEAVQVQSYDELYNIYTGIYLNGSGDAARGAENGDGVEIITDEDTASPQTETSAVTETTPAITEAAPATETEIPQETIEAVRSDFSDADIVKSSDKCIYYICGGTLYAVSKEDMAVVAEITEEDSPFEMYVRGNSLVLISEHIASDPEDSSEHTSVCVDIFDISDGAPVRLKSYKQNGVYTSARIDDSGILYLVTGYSDYRAVPLDENADLESYVPAYYVDGEKNFVAAEDIIVPPGANNTDYTVISAVKCSDPVNVTVKAVLGSSADAYCSDSSLYVASSGVKDGVAYTSVTSFDISENGLVYKASGSVDGELISRYSMCESDGVFRIACRAYNENGMITTNIYTLDSALVTVSETRGLLPGVIAGAVKFDGSYASIFENGGTEPALVVDLDQSSPVGDETAAGFMAAYVNSFGDDLMVGISAVPEGCFRLELYSSDEGVKLSEICFAQTEGAQSPALTDKKAMLTDPENGIIGIPVSSVTEFGVKNQYFVFGCDRNGFTEKGVFEYNDLDDSYRFDRAVVTDGVLYIIGSGRMVSVSLADMTVIDAFDF
ncbi:beta-propeller domain-containing protein [Huintestinicola sp.]|uniref:beta-propeller domain-containing protein n=1 Tax=Huintestinicola sp. TaxID=2981661 RepID=UPI003D7CAAEA